MCRSTLALWMFVLLAIGSPLYAQQDRLSMYGYFDLEFEASNKDDRNTHTFDQHHFNVITVFQLDEKWRVFGEIEWEHGISLARGAGAGQVALERAWVEYAHTDGFRVKLGKFLPPFGIYNLQHDATPTFLSTFLPSSIYGTHPNTVGKTQRLYSKFGTGVQVLGTLFPGTWQGDYFVYLTNGRGPDPDEKDNNQNKGIGGRFVLTAPDDRLRLGVSYYQDRNGDAQNTKQRSLAGDVTVTLQEFAVEAEGLLPSVERVDARGVPNGDFRTGVGFYVQGSYRTPVGLTPFARYDFFDPDNDSSRDAEQDVVVGLNYRATDRVYLKSEVHALAFENPRQRNYEMFVASIAVAF
ncbi:MAG: porin [Gemmatimonadetes bacterium]|nr:porin [Gemmatimonadota bacterium]